MPVFETEKTESMSEIKENSEKVQRQSLMVMVGDPSADKHIVQVLQRIKDSKPGLSMWGVGGERMKEFGVDLMFNIKDFAVVGLMEVVRYLPLINRMKNQVLDSFRKNRPDVILMVDFGAFNLRIARMIRKEFPDQKIIYFISPQVWATRPWRIKTVAENVTKMLVIWPFEEALYRKRGVDARFVGHPLALQIHENQLMSKEEFSTKLGFPADSTVIAVFPGSRKQEIAEHLPVLLDAIEELSAERPELRFVISKASASVSKIFDRIIEKRRHKLNLERNVFFLDGKDNYSLLKNADIVWAKSGTTTLEVAMFGKPMLIFYRGNWLSYFAVVLYLTVKHVGMPNLLAGHRLVPELLQMDCRAQQFVRYTSDLLDVPGLRQEISNELLNLRNQLGSENYIENCSSEVLQALGGTNT